MMDEKKFYLQDSRSYVGNDMCFWALAGGYTTDVSKAEMFTLAQAQAQHDSRETDIPWPVDYILGKTRPAVDMQYLSKHHALKDSGVVLQKLKPIRKYQERCHHCGAFMSEVQRYVCGCAKCGGDNMP